MTERKAPYRDKKNIVACANKQRTEEKPHDNPRLEHPSANQTVAVPAETTESLSHTSHHPTHCKVPNAGGLLGPGGWDEGGTKADGAMRSLLAGRLNTKRLAVGVRKNNEGLG